MKNQAEKSQKILDLLKTVAYLRSPEGYPWDQKQTNESLKKYLVEETYEVLAEIDNNSVDGLKEELGDLLFQICLHAQIQEEKGNFDISDIAEKLNKKMISRHPHVFEKDYESKKINNSEQVVDQWEKIKAAEKSPNTSPFESIPAHLPALMRGLKILKKADKLNLKLNENKFNNSDLTAEEELADSLVKIILKAKELNLDPEEVLRQRIAKIQEQFENQLIGE